MARASASPKPSGSILSRLQLFFFWLKVRQDTPSAWFSGPYSRIKALRFSVVLLSLLNFSMLMFSFHVFTASGRLFLWTGIEASIYIIVAIVFLLGLRIWYAPSLAFFVLNLFIDYFLEQSEFLSQLSSSVSLLLSLTWVYLVLAAVVLMRYDKGSKLSNDLMES